MHLGPTTHAAQQLCTLQTLLYSLNGWGLHVAERAMRRTPDGFSRELRAEHSALLTRSVAERWVLQQMLPSEAPNDPPALPGAA